ncbi:hypothetical protein OPKNFCMD_6148 [Methylobacterium crusticola]|uniref:Uncharacterized protein n=1 Tax=Methylobacterium crusticola TaxID=1697972 RepID=A0ABQ4R6U1_9HYPH|nr:hypothetical protein [Methylobacterium crusticola]GJD53373.1 hypothetical protein OPKNFCMD_6148 [Methylobacterium crusticola]
MQTLVTARTSPAWTRRAAGLVLLAALLATASPAVAQDLLGILQHLFAPAQRPPSDRFHDGRFRPGHGRPVLRALPMAGDDERPARPRALKPKDPGEVANPVPALLADTTLQYGDVVMTPQGARVFVGQPGAHHTLADFAPLSQAGGLVPASTRRVVASLPVGVNTAWDSGRAGSGGRLAGGAGGPRPAGEPW